MKVCSLLRHNTENSAQIYTKKELRGLSTNFHIQVPVSDLYIPKSQDRSAYSAAVKYVDRFWEYINRSQALECGNWDRGRAFPFPGIHKWNFRCSVLKPSRTRPWRTGVAVGRSWTD
jgi:hypothetical protein